MPVSRRRVTAGLAATLAAPTLLLARPAQAVRTLRISHPYPAGSPDDGDFHDRLAQRFATEVATRTGGEVMVRIYAGAALVRPRAQFSALSHGAIDMAVVPLDDASGDLPEAQIALMPGLVGSVRQGMAWRAAPVGQRLDKLLLAGGVRLLSWAWNADAIVSSAGPIVAPADAKGLRIRAISPPMATMLQAAGALPQPVPLAASREALAAGRIDAALASSYALTNTGLLAASRHVTTARQGSLRVGLTPLLASRKVLEALPPALQAAIIAAGQAVEPFALEAAEADAAGLAAQATQAGVAVHDMTPDALAQWQELARGTAWRNYAARSRTCAELLRLAQDVPA